MKKTLLALLAALTIFSIALPGTTWAAVSSPGTGTRPVNDTDPLIPPPPPPK